MWTMLLASGVGPGGKSYIASHTFEVLLGVDRRSYISSLSFEVLIKVV